MNSWIDAMVREEARAWKCDPPRADLIYDRLMLLVARVLIERDRRLAEFLGAQSSAQGT